MSERIPKIKNEISKRARKVGAVAGIMAVSAGAGAAVEGSSGQAADTPSKGAVADHEITQQIALRQPVNVLSGGEAIVHMKDGREVRIKNPIVAENGAVGERTRGEDAGALDAVKTYAQGEGEVGAIAYFDGNAPLPTGVENLDPDGFSSPHDAARVASSEGPVIVEPNPDIAGANYFVPEGSEGLPPQQIEHIGQGSVELPPQQPK